MAGAGYKLFNTGDVLTAAQVNTYLQEQVVMVFANATARTTALSGVLAEGMVSYLKDTNATEVYDGSSWVGIASGDITAVVAGVGMSGGGTSGSVTLTNDMASTITAAGDIVVGTGSGTYDNLPIGTTGQVLTADTTVSPYKVKWATAGGASGLSWSLINSGGTALTGAGTITVGSISNKDNLMILIMGASGASASAGMRIRFNSDSGSNYIYVAQTQAVNATYAQGDFYSGNSTSYTSFDLANLSTNADSTINAGMYVDGAASSTFKSVHYFGRANRGSGTETYNNHGYGMYNASAAITSVSVSLTSGNFDAGTIYVYGA